MLSDRQIDQLDGRDLDLAVAVHLLGFRYYDAFGGRFLGVWPPLRLPGWMRWNMPIHRERLRFLGPSPRGQDVAADWHRLTTYQGEVDVLGQTYPSSMPRFYADMNAAWLLTSHPLFQLTMHRDERGWVMMWATRDDTGFASDDHAHAARAICRAALKAVMHWRIRRLTRHGPRPPKAAPAADVLPPLFQPATWYCACGWSGLPNQMSPNPSGSNCCPHCGASGGLETRPGGRDSWTILPGMGLGTDERKERP